ncbi:MAG: DUF5009 domain-containing protein [Bacteroides sp.]|nr:DUF5009 domain-containing protein [Bacteroides sp.]
MKQRLVALDALRGLTVGCMILVNSAGSWSYVYPPLAHMPWNGISLADVIFPLFLFMMGISMYISLRKFSFQLTRPLFVKIVRRTVILFLVGTLIYGTATFLGAFREALQQPETAGHAWALAVNALGHVRILGVLQRLALCYGMGALLVTQIRYERLLPLALFILLAYFLLLLAGNGFVYGPENILSKVDVAVLGMERMINDHGMDPEGVLSTIPSVAHVLIGFWFGGLCLGKGTLSERLNRLFLYGTLALLAGFLLQDICPLNKKVWSPTFVGVTCGFSALLLAVFLWFIDVTQKWKHVDFLTVWGVNPLFCYVFSELIYILADYLPLLGSSLHTHWYTQLVIWVDNPTIASFLYACCFTGMVWMVGWYLKRKEIYVKL